MIKLILVIICVILLPGCADVQHVTGLVGEPAGFWSGLWHGLILPISFIGYLFTDTIAVYAVNNNGGWYVFGFCVGIYCLHSSIA